MAESHAKQTLTRQPSERVRWRALNRLEKHLELPMALLAFVWLVLFVVEVVAGSRPMLTFFNTAIWIVFIAEFLLRLVIAPKKIEFLNRSWLTIISLLVPALRNVRIATVVRAARLVRAARGIRLVRTVGALNRGMTALGHTIRRNGVIYVFALVVIVWFGGAAGMYTLEPHGSTGQGFASYGDALWWTAMIITTLGSAYWPQTAEGRVLAVLISLVAIGVFGYVTATLSSFFVGRDADSVDGATAGAGDVKELLREVKAVRAELREIKQALNVNQPAR
jgi:voltage-gated potassium channel